MMYNDFYCDHGAAQSAAGTPETVRMCPVKVNFQP